MGDVHLKLQRLLHLWRRIAEGGARALLRM
jgi:hypothetical protein